MRVAILLLGFLCWGGTCQSVENCANSPGTIGYTSIANINLDIEQEAGRVSEGALPLPLYIYPLCPEETLVFNEGDIPIRPAFENSSFVCGNIGEGNNCVIQGGATQVQIDNQFAPVGSILNGLNFVGITFAGFSGTSFGIFGQSENVEVAIRNCDFMVSTLEWMTQTLDKLCFSPL